MAEPTASEVQIELWRRDYVQLLKSVFNQMDPQARGIFNNLSIDFKLVNPSSKDLNLQVTIGVDDGLDPQTAQTLEKGRKTFTYSYESPRLPSISTIANFSDPKTLQPGFGLLILLPTSSNSTATGPKSAPEDRPLLSLGKNINQDSLLLFYSPNGPPGSMGLIRVYEIKAGGTLSNAVFLDEVPIAAQRSEPLFALQPVWGLSPSEDGTPGLLSYVLPSFDRWLREQSLDWTRATLNSATNNFLGTDTLELKVPNSLVGGMEEGALLQRGLNEQLEERGLLEIAGGHSLFANTFRWPSSDGTNFILQVSLLASGTDRLAGESYKEVLGLLEKWQKLYDLEPRQEKWAGGTCMVLESKQLSDFWNREWYLSAIPNQLRALGIQSNKYSVYTNGNDRIEVRFMDNAEREIGVPPVKTTEDLLQHAIELMSKARQPQQWQTVMNWLAQAASDPACTGPQSDAIQLAEYLCASRMGLGPEQLQSYLQNLNPKMRESMAVFNAAVGELNRLDRAVNGGQPVIQPMVNQYILPKKEDLAARGQFVIR